jgi:hypothetical protein
MDAGHSLVQNQAEGKIWSIRFTAVLSDEALKRAIFVSCFIPLHQQRLAYAAVLSQTPIDGIINVPYNALSNRTFWILFGRIRYQDGGGARALSGYQPPQPQKEICIESILLCLLEMAACRLREQR